MDLIQHQYTASNNFQEDSFLWMEKTLKDIGYKDEEHLNNNTMIIYTT